MRIRALKPGFFKNEQLAELSSWHRLCYEGLWCCADREGRIEDRPKRLKAEIFPYDDLDMNALLWDLARAGFIRRYAIKTRPLIDVPTWQEHQHPRADEADSQLPAYETGSDRPDPQLSLSQDDADVDTDPSLTSDGITTPARMGNGTLDLGHGEWDMGEAPREAARAQDLIDLWNEVTKPPIPRCRELSPGRRKKIRLRLAKRPSMAEWRDIFQEIQANTFYSGKNDRGWTVEFDWIVKNDDKPTQVLERARQRQATPEAVHEKPFSAAELAEAKRILSNRFGRCQHDPPCRPGECVLAIAREVRQKRGAA